MIHDRFYRLQLRTISASFTAKQRQNADRKMIVALFFLHLMDENKHYIITNKINIQNKYLSPTINSHHGDRYPKSWPILLADKIGQLYRSSDIPFSSQNVAAQIGETL